MLAVLVVVLVVLAVLAVVLVVLVFRRVVVIVSGSVGVGLGPR